MLSFHVNYIKAVQLRISEWLLMLTSLRFFFFIIPVPVQVKTDLLHVYTNDVEDASPLELRSFNVELLQKKINDLEEENKNLHDEASQVSSLLIRAILTNHNS